MISPSFVPLILIPAFVSAANDWSVPCFQGVCSYDVQQRDDTIPATMIIAGSRYSVSDITGAAGWEIVNCTNSTTDQDIRLICTGEDDQSTGCDHLYQRGAVGTIVRLPESCGKGPFARVAKAWTPEDQSLPQSVAARLVRRDGSLPTVRALSLDTQFDKATSMLGEVAMFVYGVSGQDPANDETTALQLRRLSRRGLDRRGLRSVFRKVVDSFSIGEFNKTESKALPPVSLVGDFPIFNQSVDCSPNTKASLAVNVNTNSTAQVKLGVVAAGKLLPFQIDEFAVVTDLSADLKGTIKIDADIQGKIDSGNILLFQLGIPGFDIPGILTIGPSFKLNARAIASLDIDLDLAVDIAYKVENTKVFFPPQRGQKSGGIAVPENSPLQLSLSPNVTTKSSIEAHLIPSLDLGISALTFASATVFVELDASAKLGLNFSAGTTVQLAGSPASGDNVYNSSATGNSTDVAAPRNATKEADGSDVNFNGCVDLVGGVAASAGADASFFGLFNAGTRVPIFDQQFELFKKCFGDGDIDSVAYPPTSAAPANNTTESAGPANLLCLLPDIAKANSLIQDVLIPSSATPEPVEGAEVDVKQANRGGKGQRKTVAIRI